VFTGEQNKAKLQASAHKFWMLRKNCKRNLEMVLLLQEKSNLRRTRKKGTSSLCFKSYLSALGYFYAMQI
jgi:hypothetical protein